MDKMRASTKVGIGLLIVLIALMVALWLQVRSPTTQTGLEPSFQSEGGAPADNGELAALRAEAGLEPCPVPSGVPAKGPLAGLTLECLTDGAPVDVGAALAGKPAVLNLWAYWCAPCRAELPAMAQFAERAGDAVTVLTVHEDKNQDRGLAVLAELGVRLPAVDDPESLLVAAARAPNVLPVTVLLRADGSVAALLPVPFTDADQIAAAVREHLGVQL